MKQLIHNFPQNITDALAIAAKATIQSSTREIKNITICGMGGSGIGGKIVAQWMTQEVQVPITILNDYSLPSYVDEHSLVIGSSYSGNTEETLAAIYTAHDRGARIIGISSGGAMVDFCAKKGYDCIQVPGGSPPRAALAFSVVQLVTVFVQLGLASEERLTEIKRAQELLVEQEANIHEIGKQLAQFLYGKVGIIYSGPDYDGIAIRARQQFNENSKYLSWSSVIPEMNHNELVGWGGGDHRFAPVFLYTEDMDPRNKMRYRITIEHIETKVERTFEVIAIGNSQIERSFYLVNIVDWASWYLSELNAVDAMDIRVIDFLKNELSKFN